MTELTVREGDGDAKRTGYWNVTGPQPERDLYGLIYLHIGEVYSWEIMQRSTPERNSISTFMVPVAHGNADTHAEALEGIADAWPDGPVEDSDARADMWPYGDL